MSVDPVAIINNASFHYGSTVALRNVSFTLYQGEYACLVGRNGCGKSTLMKGILGLLTPVTGTVEIAVGKDATAFLPQLQQTEANFPATVWEVVLSGCQRSGEGFWYSATDKDKARQCMELLGVNELARRRIGLLSGGQRQRAFLARCLCRDPKFLLLDEPYSGLDPEAAIELNRILEALCVNGMTILMSSHDLGAVAACASRVLVLEGSLVFDGSVREWVHRYQEHCG